MGTTQLRYHLSCIEDLHRMLTEHADWMALGNTDEQKEAPSGTVEAWGRSPKNPVHGWYGFKKGLRGPYSVLCTACVEAIGLADAQAPRKQDAGDLT